MQICETVTPRGRRYYIDGRRASRALIVAVKGDHVLDTFHTVIRGEVVRHYCHARTRANR